MDSLQQPAAGLMPPADIAIPATPEMSHATLPGTADPDTQMTEKTQLAAEITPPPSSQQPIPQSPLLKTRTPSPIDAISHISTPPPTVDAFANNAPLSRAQQVAASTPAEHMDATELAAATPEELKTSVLALQGALREAKMSAAHHKLQYQMLAQESRAALERMAVEAHMTQCENQIIHHHNAEQAKAAATVAPSVAAAATQPLYHDGTIPVQKELYHRLIREIQLLGEANAALEGEYEQQERMIRRQEHEIASLTDKVTLMRELMRERTRDVRELQLQQTFPNTPRRAGGRTAEPTPTPRSAYHTATPLRSHLSGGSGGRGSSGAAQPFAALLQASEIASQDAARSQSAAGARRGHTRNTHSFSHLPSTPQHPPSGYGRPRADTYTTPQQHQGRSQHTQAAAAALLRAPATAPVHRTSDFPPHHQHHHHHPSLQSFSARLTAASRPRASSPGSEGTVSASDAESDRDGDHDIDSEAETEILEPEDGAAVVAESQASRAASSLLRRSREEVRAQRESFQGSGMLPPSSSSAGAGAGAGGAGASGGDRYRQTKLFGAVRKANVDRSGGVGEEQGRPAKRKRGQDEMVVGLGIAGVRE